MKAAVLAFGVALALPLMAVAQGDQQNKDTSTKETETNQAAQGNQPVQGKQTQHSTATEQNAPKAATQEHSQTTNVQADRTGDHKDAAAGASTETSQTHAKTESTTTSKTKVTAQEFRTRHADVFSLGVHPKTFFLQKYGENHVRLISNMYFVYLDGCWVSVHVDGYGYSERVICAGDPDYVEVY